MIVNRREKYIILTRPFLQKKTVHLLCRRLVMRIVLEINFVTSLTSEFENRVI